MTTEEKILKIIVESSPKFSDLADKMDMNEKDLYSYLYPLLKQKYVKYAGYPIVESQLFPTVTAKERIESIALRQQSSLHKELRTNLLYPTITAILGAGIGSLTTYLLMK
ncbi:hypothetical protein [Paucilactobacillus vaccinostercus]|uniref:hypothetical protein n=1 Tax=Paucilactobacillus vaccinostercus TaxID=176291 RepID=UPI00070DE71C|nr:hypothetical protein [Paucilactobacillus vaccinostercus]